MIVQLFRIGFILALFLISGCYAHQGKQFNSASLISDAETACLRNDPAAARAFLQMQLRQTESSSDVEIAQDSLRANSLCVALQSLVAARSSATVQ